MQSWERAGQTAPYTSVPSGTFKVESGERTPFQVSEGLDTGGIWAYPFCLIT